MYLVSDGAALGLPDCSSLSGLSWPWLHFVQKGARPLLLGPFPKQLTRQTHAVLKLLTIVSCKRNE